jgi:translation initiation factor 3 subunit K
MGTQGEWIKPGTRPEIIDQLVEGVDRYNPSNVGILEDYLYHQTREKEYDCLANLAILKLYQFNPELYNADVVVHILLKALTATPLPDFNLCVALLGQRNGQLLPDGEPDPLIQLLPQLTELSNLLLNCRFPTFWTTFRSDDLSSLRENFTVECIGFEDAMREVAVRAVKAAFRKIDRKRLGSYLELEGADLDQYVAQLGWTLDSATGVISIPPNPDNQIEATVVQESIEFPQLAKVLAHAQAAA